MQGLVQNTCRKLHAGEEEEKKKNKPLFHLLVKHLISIIDPSWIHTTLILQRFFFLKRHIYAYYGISLLTYFICKVDVI